jgi:biopolymer transport protein ExbD
LQLPVSTSKNTPEMTTTVKITRSSVLFNDTVVAQNASFQNSSDMLIKPLFRLLKRTRTTTSNSAAAPAEMMIQSDREIEFNVIKRVMYTCSKAGYSDFTVLVMKEE